MAHRYPFQLFSFHPSFRYCVFGVWSRLQVLDFQSKKLFFVPTDVHKDAIRQVLFTKDGKKMISFGDDKQVVFWNLDNEKLTFSPSAPRPIQKKVSKAMFYDDEESKVMYCDKGGDVAVIEESGDSSQPEVLLGHYAVLTDMALSRDRKLIATSDRDEKIKVSLFPKTYIAKTFCYGHTQFVTNIGFLNDRLVSGAGDGTLRVWNPLTGAMLSTSSFVHREGKLSLELVPREMITDKYIYPEEIEENAPVVSKIVICEAKKKVFVTVEGHRALYVFNYDDTNAEEPRFFQNQEPITLPFEVYDMQLIKGAGPYENKLFVSGDAPYFRVISIDESQELSKYSLVESDPEWSSIYSLIESEGSYEDANREHTIATFSPTAMRKKHLIPPHIAQARKRQNREGQENTGKDSAQNSGDDE
eukprot:TRINITY_DN2485_c1_g1_i1.p1 TRINITY_DN2485_c1_g1~~TRINITY_DN2485_c1_g1_i1.p1  ORF type:complete len:416 (-),score=94.03 TRINITY_DN2485_c1_g1_i1:205-1452(-)